jgi:hypothetical protein
MTGPYFINPAKKQGFLMLFKIDISGAGILN